MTLIREHSSYSSMREASKKRRGERPEEAFALCKHNAPILVLPTEAGYCAHCFMCLELGADRPTAKEARKALLDPTPRY